MQRMACYISAMAVISKAALLKAAFKGCPVTRQSYYLIRKRRDQPGCCCAIARSTCPRHRNIPAGTDTGVPAVVDRYEVDAGR
jgi:hypothetical protein